MKKIMQGWTISRVLYLAGGIFFILVAAFDRAWFMIPLGLYFMAMSIFRFGCVGGACEIVGKEEGTQTL